MIQKQNQSGIQTIDALPVQPAEQVQQQEPLLSIAQLTVLPPAWGEKSDGQPLLSNMTLQVNRGQFVVLLGRNGSGKSTLAKVVAGLWTSDLSGTVIRHGTEPLPKQSQRRIPIVMQQPEASMVGATPWEDVVLMLEQHGVPSGEIVPRAELALHEVGLGGRMHQTIETLSGGQKQLVAIAGCLAAEAPLLLLDEVTAMLDAEAAGYVHEQVRMLHRRGATIVWITQKMDDIRPGDRIVMLQDGQLAYEGTAEQWFTQQDDAPGTSPCEQYGFEAPYPVQVVWGLTHRGVHLQPMPLTRQQLVQAVQAYGS